MRYYHKVVSDIMDDAKSYELLIGIFIVFIMFNYLYPGTAFYTMLFGVVALVGVIFFLRGTVAWIFGKGTGSMWIGAAICFMLIILFNGFNVIISAFNLVLAAIAFIVVSIVALL